MKSNLAYFFTYTKNLRKTQSKIGPLTDENNKVINSPVANVLQEQYSSVWSKPAENYKVDDPKQFFRTSVQGEPEENFFEHH